ncbi:TIGR03546 family protein [bacterium]
MFWFKIIKKVVKILHSNATPAQIALAIAFGLLAGFSPALSPQAFFFLLLIFIINMNLGMAFISMGLFKLLVLLFDAPSHYLGTMFLVDMSFLKGFWTMLYNMPIIPFTKFNNTVVLGNLIIAVAGFIPVYFLSKKGVVFYREKLQEKVEKFKIMKIFKASKFYNWYQKLLA